VKTETADKGVIATYRRVLRRAVVDTCILTFIADVVFGVQAPVFPLYTTSLGASLWLLGLITAVLGLTSLACALPVGVLSDRVDRKTVLVAGMVTFAVSFVLYATVPSAGWLVVPRALQAIATVATVPLGIAYIGDLVEPRDRSAAIGVYTASMGVGFAIGPLLGSWTSSVAGYPAAYLLGAAIAVVGAAFGAVRLKKRRAISGATSLPRRFVDVRAVIALVRQPVMVMACIANVAMTLSMSGAILTFFPVYARGVGLSTVAIGTIFAWRGLASALGRVPLGALSAWLPTPWILALVLLVEATINLGISRTSSPTALAALLIMEGIGYGVFLVASQSAVATDAGSGNRGAGFGLYWMAESLGELFGPIGIGLIAQAMGVVAAFQTVAATVASCAALVAGLGAIAAHRSRRVPSKIV
jgi:MFS family permease